MDTTIAAIRLLDAIAGGIRQAPGPEGDDRIVAVSDDPMLVTQLLRSIVQALDWRLEVVDAVRTNFNDLDTGASPLLSMVLHATNADLQYVLVVQNAVPALLTDQQYRRHMNYMSRDLPVVLCMAQVPDEMPEAPGTWTVVDLRAPR